MSAMTNQQRILLLVVGVLLVLVVADKAGLFTRGTQSGSLRVEYSQLAAQVEHQHALVESADAWESARARAAESWRNAESRVLKARSTDLAEQDLHDRIESEMRTEHISIAAWRAIDQPAPKDPTEQSDVRRIEVVFEFAAPSSDALYRIIDRIENMPDLWARALTINIEGPGIMQLDNASLDVTLRVVSVASLSAAPIRSAMAAPPMGGTDVN